MTAPRVTTSARARRLRSVFSDWQFDEWIDNLADGDIHYFYNLMVNGKMDDIMDAFRYDMEYDDYGEYNDYDGDYGYDSFYEQMTNPMPSGTNPVQSHHHQQQQQQQEVHPAPNEPELIIPDECVMTLTKIGQERCDAFSTANGRYESQTCGPVRQPRKKLTITPFKPHVQDDGTKVKSVGECAGAISSKAPIFIKIVQAGKETFWAIKDCRRMLSPQQCARFQTVTVKC